MSLSIGLHINKTLQESDELSEMTGNRIFPVYIANGTPSFPFVEFECQTGAPTYTKDGVLEDNHTATINCVAKSYEQSLKLAEAVRKALELKTATYPEFTVTECRMESCTDDWVNDLGAYCAEIVFSLTSE